MFFVFVLFLFSELRFEETFLEKNKSTCLLLQLEEVNQLDLETDTSVLKRGLGVEVRLDLSAERGTAQRGDEESVELNTLDKYMVNMFVLCNSVLGR